MGRAAYGAAKAGVIQLTRVMAVELAARGVGVNAISPGPVDTDQSRGTHTPGTRRAYLERIPLKRYGEGCAATEGSKCIHHRDTKTQRRIVQPALFGFLCASVFSVVECFLIGLHAS